MTFVMIILGIILGLALAVGLAFMITMIRVSKSNDLGNSKGDFKSFSRVPLHMINKRDRINPNKYR